MENDIVIYTIYCNKFPNQIGIYIYFGIPQLNIYICFGDTMYYLLNIIFFSLDVTVCID